MIATKKKRRICLKPPLPEEKCAPEDSHQKTQDYTTLATATSTTVMMNVTTIEMSANTRSRTIAPKNRTLARRPIASTGEPWTNPRREEQCH